ncbi:pyrroline-5-carboxylate reductase [Stieleria varia]|nr:pyrroline-5-carboxylate reductase [Stieleria varia]
MSKKRLTVIGGGQMGRALVGGMVAANVLSPAEICVVEPSAESRLWWQTQHGDIDLVVDSTDPAADSQIVLIAVKPNVVPVVASQKDGMWSGKLVISIAAGVNLSKLADWFGHQRVVRVMPNTPCLVGQGACAYCCGNDVGDEDKQWISAALSAVGLAVEVNDSQMDAVTGLSGSGPAYICLVIEAMADGGVLAGLPRHLAMQLASQTVLGTAKMVQETGRHPGELKDAVASPGGTTIAGLQALENKGLRSAMIAAVEASMKRSQQLDSLSSHKGQGAG